MKNDKKVSKKSSVESASQTSATSARSLTKYLRIGPRKLRIVIDEVRHKPVHRAFAILSQIKRKGARMAEKVLKSAVANAKVLGMDENRLVVAEIRADGGPVMKRFLSRSMGRADRMLKRMSHLFIRVEEGRNSGGSSSVVIEESAKQSGASKASKEKASTKRKTAKAAKA